MAKIEHLNPNPEDSGQGQHLSFNPVELLKEYRHRHKEIARGSEEGFFAQADNRCIPQNASFAFLTNPVENLVRKAAFLEKQPISLRPEFRIDGRNYT